MSARGYNAAAGFAGGVYAELGLDTTKLEQGIEAAEKKLRSYEKEFRRVDELHRIGTLNNTQYANSVVALGDLQIKTQAELDKQSRVLADTIGKQPGIWKTFTKGLADTAAASGLTGRGLLQLSYAVDDVQYGFRAIVNNIPLIVTQFGGSAGLAAGAQIAAVAFNQFGLSYQDVIRVMRGTGFDQEIQDWKRWIDGIREARNQVDGMGSDYLAMRSKIALGNTPGSREANEFKKDVLAGTLEAKPSKEEEARIKAFDEAVHKTAGGVGSLESALTGPAKVLQKDKDRAEYLEREIAGYEKRIKEAEGGRQGGEKIGPETARQIISDLLSVRSGHVKELGEIQERARNQMTTDVQARIGGARRRGGRELDAIIEHLQKTPGIEDLSKNIQIELDEANKKTREERERAKQEKIDEKNRKEAERKEALGINKMAGIYQQPMTPELRGQILEQIGKGKSTEDAISTVAEWIKDKLTDVAPAHRAEVARELATRVGEATSADVTARSLGGLTREQAARALAADDAAKARRLGGGLKEDTEAERDTNRKARDLLRNDAMKASAARAMALEGEDAGMDAARKSKSIADISKKLADAAGDGSKPEDFKEAAKLILESMKTQLKNELQTHALEHGLTMKGAAKQIAEEEATKAEDKARAEKNKREGLLRKEAEERIPGIGILSRADLERRLMRGGNTDKTFENVEDDISKALEKAGMDPKKAAEAAKLEAKKAQHDLNRDLNNDLVRGDVQVRQSQIHSAGDFYGQIHGNLRAEQETGRKSLEEHLKHTRLLAIIAANQIGEKVIKIQ